MIMLEILDINKTDNILAKQILSVKQILEFEEYSFMKILYQ